MDHFAFDRPVDVFIGKSRFTNQKAIVYRRFVTGAEAIRYAIEQQGADKLATTVIEAGEARFESADIRRLYESADYPFPRRHVS